MEFIIMYQILTQAENLWYFVSLKKVPGYSDLAISCNNAPILNGDPQDDDYHRIDLVISNFKAVHKHIAYKIWFFINFHPLKTVRTAIINLRCY